MIQDSTSSSSRVYLLIWISETFVCFVFLERKVSFIWSCVNVILSRLRTAKCNQCSRAGVLMCFCASPLLLSSFIHSVRVQSLRFHLVDPLVDKSLLYRKKKEALFFFFFFFRLNSKASNILVLSDWISSH